MLTLMGQAAKSKWDRYTTPVGSFKPNGHGLYDMTGNVYEWCQEWYDSNIRFRRVLRGGDYNYPSSLLQVADRGGNLPTDRFSSGGFRCVSGSNSYQPPPPTPASNQGITWEKDNSQMALIPGGSFEMGDHFGEGGTNERPVHRVELDAFYMDVYEVTVGQFREFVNQSGYKYRGNWDNVAKYSLGDDYPMIYVDWIDATAYAKWAGKRLPTEAEWDMQHVED